MSDTYESKYLSRKFLICVVSMVIATMFRMNELIDASDWTNLAITCVGAYNVSNAISNRTR
jgi:hypothetical protein